MRKILCALLMLGLVMLVGCGGDDNPAAPESVPQTANIAGVWLGNGVTVSGSPTNHPVVQAIAPYFGDPSPVSVAVTQNGTSVSFRVTDTGTGTYTDYAGTIGANAFTAQWTWSSMATITGIECGDGIQRDLTCTSDNITGTVSGNSLSFAMSTTYNCRITSSQAAAGVVILNANFAVTKSK